MIYIIRPEKKNSKMNLNSPPSGEIVTHEVVNDQSTTASVY